jgi:hypothetical protein
MEDSSQDGARARLGRASSRELLRLVTGLGDALTPGDARRVLRNPFATGEVIEALLGARRLAASYDVRSAIARHRRAPESVALRFVSGLFWRDLLEISVDVRISPAVRRVAEKYLIRRLSRLTTGEKVTLARRATAEVQAHLRGDPNLRVIQALLENPRLTEATLLPLAASEKTLPRVLDLVARDPRWGSRYEIRLALARNTRSPFRAIFEILPTLRRQDLLAVARREEHSWVVRHRARELLESSTPLI